MSVFIGYPSFMAYQMMKGKKGNNDGFPSIPGMIARYSASGLINEQMAANPVWVDKTGNGHDLQLKNFAWKGMSGVNGYVQNFNNFKNNATVDKVRIDEQSSNSIKVTILTTGISNAIYIPKNIYQFNKSYFIKISSEGYDEGDMALSFYATSTSTATTVTVSLNPNGVTEIPAIKEDDFLAVYINVSGKVGSFTVEQLPLYPGFILGDGVDDFAVTENNLDLEDTYTIYTPLILLKYGGVVCGKNSDKDFSLNTVISSKSIGFDSANAWSGSIPVDLFEFVLVACKRSPQTMYVKDLVTGKSNQNKSKEFVPNPRKYFVWRNVGGIWCQVAIAGQIICNGYYSTDEDDEKVLDWYKKQYPWLFPDQAWTVTGKTNEDEDRATIANITGNGNDLVLSNFGFAEGSGYGLYKLNFNNWFANSGSGNVNIVNVVNPHKIVLEQSQEAVGAFFLGKNVSYSGELKISVSNKPSDIELSFGSTALGKVILNEGINIVKINPVNTSIGFFTNKAFEAQNIIIEQIPEYEGYLVTDGVDDKAVSKQFKFGENFTVILDFKFPVKKISDCGFDLSAKVRIQNLQDSGVYVVLKGNKTLIPSNVVRAVTSEGKVYDENWNEYNIVPGNISSNYTMVNLGFDGSNQFAESATKLVGIYSSTLSKDDCIKAYNYLQTLKAK